VAAVVSLLCLGLTTLLLVALDLVVGLGERRRARSARTVSQEDA